MIVWVFGAFRWAAYYRRKRWEHGLLYGGMPTRNDKRGGLTPQRAEWSRFAYDDRASPWEWALGEDSERHDFYG